MAHGWDPYLDNLPSLTSEQGTPETEVSHPRHADDFIGHDGFSGTAVSDEVSATNTNYYFSPSIGNTNSDWSPETVRHYRDMTWQAGEDQKEYLPKWENSAQNFETTGHCPFAPDLEGLKQDCATPTVTPFFENYLHVNSPSDTEGEGASTSVPNPKTDDSSSDCHQDHTENTKLSTEYPYPNIDSSSLRNKSLGHDEFSSPDMISHTQSETLRSSENDQTWKQEEFVNRSHMSHEGNICPSGNLSDSRLEENHSGNETQKTEDPSCIINTEQIDAKDASELHKTEKPNLIKTGAFGEKEMHLTGSQGKNAQTDSPDKESQLNTFHSDKTASKEHLCEIGKHNFEEIVSPLQSKTSQENMASDPVNSNVSLRDVCETSNHLDSGLQVQNAVSQYQEKGTETAETVELNSNFDQLTANSPFQNLDFGASALSRGRLSVFSDSKDQSDLSTKGLEIEQASPAEKTSTSACKIMGSSDFATSDDSHCTDSCDNNNELAGVTDFCSYPPVTSDSPSIAIDEKNEQYIFDSSKACLKSYNVGGHIEPLLEKEMPSQSEERDPTFDQQLMHSPSLHQTPEEISSPDQTIIPKTPENTGSSLDQTKTHSSEQLQQSLKDTTSPLEQLSLHQSAEEIISSFDHQQSLSQDTGKLVSSPEQAPWHSPKSEKPVKVGDKNLTEFDEHLSVHNDPCGELSRHDSYTEKNDIPALDPYQLEKTSIGKSPQLKSSSEMWTKLQPVVLLKTLDPVDLSSNMYTCAGCMHTNSNLDRLIEHYHFDHLMQSFQLCKTCDVYLVSQDPSEKHLCGKLTYSPKLSSFPGKRKKEKDYRCHKCGLHVLNINQYVSHMRTHTGKTPFRCDKCGFYFAQRSTLRRHKKIPGRCGKPIPVRKPAAKSQKGSVKMLNCYVKLHDIAKTPFCVFCGKCFTTEVKAKKHIYNVHVRPDKEVSTSKECKAPTEKTGQDYSEEKKYKCPLCPHIFKHFFNRARHLRGCVKDVTFGGKNRVGGRYQCPLCLATFSLPSNRYRHIHRFCLRNFLQLLGQKNSKSITISQPANEMETVLDKLKAEEEQLRSQSSENVTSSECVTSSERVPGYKCNLCPALFFHASGKYRHMKKHRLSEITGQAIRYRNSLTKKAALTKYTNTGESKKEQDSVSLRCEFCEKSFGSSQSLKRHEYTHQGERPYRCLECGKAFKKRPYLIGHKTTHQRRIQCTVCRKILPSVGELIKHRQTHLQKGLLQCPDCPQQFKYPAHLLRHLPTHQKSKNKPPQDDGNQETMDSVQRDNATKTVECSLCKEVFDNLKLLRKHTFTHIARSSSPQCPFCKRRFLDRRGLLRHMTRHIVGKLFSCSKCGKQFYKNSNLKEHCANCLVNNVTQAALVCRYCSRSFLQRLHLLKHYRGHQNKTLVLCTTCNQYFGASKISDHRKGCQPITKTDSGSTAQTTKQPKIKNVPSNLKKFKCQYCPQTFKYRSLYLRHSVSHTGVQPYPCLQCGHNFPSQTLCLQHETLCDGVYREEQSRKAENLLEDTSEHKCNFCNTTFTKSRNLRRHILTHNEVKPYRCKACDSCFSRYDHLKVHQCRCKGKMIVRLRPEICIPKISLDQVGTGWQKEFELGPVEEEQTLDCKECGRSFTTQSKLNWHISMFHTVKKFKCIQCGSFFSSERSVRRHIKLRKCRFASIVSNGLLQQNISQTQPTTKIKNQNRILQRIQSTFNKKYRFKCSFCPCMFRNNSSLNMHLRLHTGEKPFVCECGKKFIRKDYLRRHIITCARKRTQSTVVCEKCGVFFPKSKLENHKNRCRVKPRPSQHAESPSQSPPHGFSCAYCSSRFLLFSQLQEHFLNAHKLETMDPPVKTAPLQQHLSNIQDIREKPLDDSEPSKSLTSSKSNTLFKSEAGPKGRPLKKSPFACKICSKGYWNKTLLRNHFRKCRINIPKKEESQEVDIPLRADIDLALTDSSADDSPQEYLESTEPQSSFSEDKKPVYQCSECDKSFTDGLLLISHLENHGREEQEKKHNKCSKCGKVFASQANLTKHMMIHKSGQFACTDCATAFSSKPELEIHRKECHDPSNPYCCKLCNYRLKTKGALCEHCTKEHPDDIFSCRFCKRNYTLRTSLIRHCRVHHPKEQMDQDEKSSRSQSTSENESYDTNEHENDKSSEESDSAPYFPCHVCGKTFSISESLEDHQRCHLGEKPHECAECGQCFFLAAQLQQHQRKHKSEFQCKICGRGFISLFALRKHKHILGKKRPFRCLKCDLSFKRASQLAEHMLSHREENFPCDICNRVFLSKSSRAEHRKSHLPNSSDSAQTAVLLKNNKKPALFSTVPPNEFKYRCGVCCERFRDPEELSEHGCMADIERRFSCLDCDKHFLHPSHLQKHISTHKQSSSQSEYPCNHCNNSFSSSHEFLKHLRNHDDPSTEIQGSTADEKRGFICPVCHQCFASAPELVYHFPMHPDGAFECKLCNMAFSTASNLKQHEVSHVNECTKTKCTKCGQYFLGSDAFSKHDCSQKLWIMDTKNSEDIKRPKHSTFGDEDEIDVTGEDLCYCPFCPMRFSSKSHLLEHQNAYHPKKKPFTCKLCGKTFAEQKYLNRHLKRHRQKESAESTLQEVHRTFQCAQCHSEFDTAKDLSLHLRLHAAEKEVGEHRCDMCYKSFSQLRFLKLHQESHVGQVVYECTECDKAFAFPHLLEEHQQSHAR